jgi:hypothetical protein
VCVRTRFACACCGVRDGVRHAKGRGLAQTTTLRSRDPHQPRQSQPTDEAHHVMMVGVQRRGSGGNSVMDRIRRGSDVLENPGVMLGEPAPPPKMASTPHNDDVSRVRDKALNAQKETYLRTLAMFLAPAHSLEFTCSPSPAHIAHPPCIHCCICAFACAFHASQRNACRVVAHNSVCRAHAHLRHVLGLPTSLIFSGANPVPARHAFGYPCWSAHSIACALHAPCSNLNSNDATSIAGAPAVPGGSQK